MGGVRRRKGVPSGVAMSSASGRVLLCVSRCARACGMFRRAGGVTSARGGGNRALFACQRQANGVGRSGSGSGSGCATGSTASREPGFLCRLPRAFLVVLVLWCLLQHEAPWLSADGVHPSLFPTAGQVITAGLESGLVTFENPKLATLFEACAAAGIGTSGLATKVHKKAGSAAPFSSAAASPPAVAEPKASTGGVVAKKQGGAGSVAKKTQAKTGSSGSGSTAAGNSGGSGSAGASGGGGGGAGSGAGAAKKKQGASGNATANGSAGAGGGEQNARGGAKGVEGAGGKPGGKLSPKPAAKAVGGGGGEDSKSPRSKTPVKVMGKPGLAVPTALFPELARIVQGGGERELVVRG